MVGIETMSWSCSTRRVPPGPSDKVTMQSSPGMRLARPTVAPSLVSFDVDVTVAWIAAPFTGWMATVFSARDTARIVPSKGVPTRLEEEGLVEGAMAPWRALPPFDPLLAKMV